MIDQTPGWDLAVDVIAREGSRVLSKRPRLPSQAQRHSSPRGKKSSFSFSFRNY